MAKMAVSSRIHPDIHIPPKTTTESRCIPLFFTELIRVRPIVHPPFHNLISMAMAPAPAAYSSGKSVAFILI